MKLLLPLSGAVFILDQATKAIVMRYLPLHTGKTVIPGFFNLVHVRNTGGAFSLLANADSSWRNTFFVLAVSLVVGFILYVYRKVGREEVWLRTAYACMIGGALGNLADRLRLGNVVDFLDFYVGAWHWPAFNVADSAVSVGGVMLAISLLRKK